MVASPADMAAECDVIVCAVAGDDAIRDVVRLLLPGGHVGLTVVSMGTVAMTTAAEIDALLDAQRIEFVDAPVSGPPASAERGELTILASGDSDVLRRIDPILRTLGSTVLPVGACGAGSAMKAILNGAARTFVGALGTAMRQGNEAGFDPDLTYEVLRHSMLASRVLEERRDLVIAACERMQRNPVDSHAEP